VLLTLILANADGAGTTLNWTEYGPLVGVLLVAVGWLSKLYLDERAETRRLNAQLYMLAERVVPLLARSTDTLEETEKGMAAALDAVLRTRARPEVGDDFMARLEELARRLEEGH